MGKNDDSVEFDTEDSYVDKEARSQIDQLRRRLEGAHLVPSLWILFKQMFQSIIGWSGWEVFGIGSFIILALALLIGLIFFTHEGCTATAIEQNERNERFEAEQEQQRLASLKEQFSPTCEALGLVYTRVQEGQIICTGSDRIVTVDTTDIDETEVHMIEQE